MSIYLFIYFHGIDPSVRVNFQRKKKERKRNITVIKNFQQVHFIIPYFLFSFVYLRFSRMFQGKKKNKLLPEGSINAPNESKDVDKVRHGFTGYEYSNGQKRGRIVWGQRSTSRISPIIISRRSIVTIFQETVNPVSRVSLI